MQRIFLYIFLQEIGFGLHLTVAVLWQIAQGLNIIETDGSARILKAGHAIEDRIEEKSKFQIGHDQAILYGMYREAQNRKDTRALSLLDALYKKFDLNSYKELPFAVETSNFGSSNE